MPDMSRRTFVTTGASLFATSASLAILRGADAATHEAATMKGHHMSEEMRHCL